MMACDVVCFPGTHSVLWEQAVGLGIPGIFRLWKGMTHVDIGKNCIFLKYETKGEMLRILKELVENERSLNDLRLGAEAEGKYRFRYSNISRKAVCERYKVEKRG